MIRKHVPASKKHDQFPKSQLCLSQERQEGAASSSYQETKVAQGNNNQSRPHVVGRKGVVG